MNNNKKFGWSKTKPKGFQIFIISKFPDMTMVNGQDSTEMPDVLLTNYINMGGELLSQSSGYGPQGLCTIWTVKVPIN